MGKQVLRNENLFFILSDILFAEQVSIERNNPVIVIFRHLLPLLPNLYFFYVMFDLLFLYVMFGLLFLYVMFGLVPDISSLDSRAKHGNDSTFFLSCHPRTSVARSGDLRIFGSSPNMTVRKNKPEYDKLLPA